MKTNLRCIGILGTALASACATANVTSDEGPDLDDARRERYDGPNARIAVADFEDKMSSSGCFRAEYGRGMSDMLATALFQTNRFIVLEREKLSHVTAEQDLAASGRVRSETAAPTGEIEGAELIVTAAVTGFDPGSKGGGVQVPGLDWLFNDVQVTANQARVSIDLRLIDTRTSRVVAATSVEGTATGMTAAAARAAGGLVGPLSGFANTPPEKAIRAAIGQAVGFVSSKTPAVYYHHTASGEAQTTTFVPPVRDAPAEPAAAGVAR